MTHLIKKYAYILTFVFTSLTVSEARANETMFKLFISSQNFTEYQEELAVNLLVEGKKLAKQIKEPKQQLKGFAQELVKIESLDVDTMMQAYKTWQAQTDEQLLVTMEAFAALHAELTPEQRQKIVDAMRKN